MDSDELRRLLKRIAIAGSFFVLALLLYLLGGTHYGLARGLLLVYAIVVTVVMLLAILLQSGRGGGLASLGGLGGDSLLGARSATPIAKATYVMGALFLFICMLLARLGLHAPLEDAGAIGAPAPPPAEQRLHVPQTPPAEGPSEPQPPATPAPGQEGQ